MHGGECGLVHIRHTKGNVFLYYKNQRPWANSCSSSHMRTCSETLVILLFNKEVRGKKIHAKRFQYHQCLCLSTSVSILSIVCNMTTLVALFKFLILFCPCKINNIVNLHTYSCVRFLLWQHLGMCNYKQIYCWGKNSLNAIKCFKVRM